MWKRGWVIILNDTEKSLGNKLLVVSNSAISGQLGADDREARVVGTILSLSKSGWDSKSSDLYYWAPLGLQLLHSGTHILANLTRITSGKKEWTYSSHTVCSPFYCGYELWLNPLLLYYGREFSTSCYGKESLFDVLFFPDNGAKREHLLGLPAGGYIL